MQKYDAEVKEQYQDEISNRFAAVEVIMWTTTGLGTISDRTSKFQRQSWSL
jgi:hypothetical protein